MMQKTYYRRSYQQAGVCLLRMDEEDHQRLKLAALVAGQSVNCYVLEAVRLQCDFTFEEAGISPAIAAFNPWKGDDDASETVECGAAGSR